MRFQLLIILILINLCSFSQKSEIDFIKHLSDADYYEEVIHLVNQENLATKPVIQRDSLRYYRGWANYNLKHLDESTADFLKVTPTSPFFYKSQFFAGYNLAYQVDYDNSQTVFESIPVSGQEFESLKHFSLSGLALLKREPGVFKNEISNVDTNYYAIRQQRDLFITFSNELKEYKTRSATLAGIFSAILPGSGKIYAGKTGQGISSLITVVGLGLVTYENYRKDGPLNYKTLFFGTAFTVFYIADIYGAVLSIKIRNQEFNDAFNNKVLFHLHIPLRTVFN